MATCIHKQTKEIQLPKAAYASLLTEEECEAGSDYIPDVVYSGAF